MKKLREVLIEVGCSSRKVGDPGPSPSQGEIARLFERLGFSTSMDAEGDFWEPGAHAAAVRKILALCGAVADIREKRQDGRILLTVKTRNRSMKLSSEEERAESDDWVDSALIEQAVSFALAGKPCVFGYLYSEDQVEYPAIIPAKVVAALKQAKLLATYDRYDLATPKRGKVNLSIVEPLRKPD